MSAVISKSSPTTVGDKAAEWLYPITAPTEETHSPYGLPFAVGTDRALVYGALPTMASRSVLITALQETNIVELAQATIAKPIALLSDAKGFGVQIPSSFKIIWNYLNGIYSYSDSDVKAWPYPDMTFDDKYMVIHFAVQLGITDNIFISNYIKSLINDFIKEHPTAADKEYRVKVILGLRTIIAGTVKEYWRLHDKLSKVMSNEDYLMLVYGSKPSIVPAGHRVIYPEEDKDLYSDLKDAKDLYMQAHSTDAECYGKSMGVWRVKSIQRLDAPTITGSIYTPGRMVTNNVGRRYFKEGEYTPSPYKLTECAVAQYYKNPDRLYTLVTVITPEGDIGFFEPYGRFAWLAPALNVKDPDTCMDVRFFAA